MSIPVVYIYLGPLPAYLQLSVDQARQKNETIVILTDCPKPVRNATVLDSRGFMDGVDEFLSVYRHMSTNSEKFEIICMIRWIILRNFMRIHGDKIVYFSDADVFNLENMTKVYGSYREFDVLYLSSKDEYMAASGACSFWKVEIIEAFCDHMTDMYTEGRVSVLQSHWAHHQSNRLKGGVCDMTLLYLFKSMVNFKSLTDVHDGVTFDANPYFEFNAGHDCYVMSEDRYYRRRLKRVQRIGSSWTIASEAGPQVRLAAVTEYAKLADRLRHKPLRRLLHSLALMSGKAPI